jgi:hypothetical protein
MFLGFAAFFFCLTWLNNRFFYPGNNIDERH